MSTCGPISDGDKLGAYDQYRPNDPQMKGCSAPRYMGKPRFFGKNSTNDTPLFVALDFEHYQIVRTGMAIATGAAIILAIALAYKMAKKTRAMV